MGHRALSVSISFFIVPLGQKRNLNDLAQNSIPAYLDEKESVRERCGQGSSWFGSKKEKVLKRELPRTAELLRWPVIFLTKYALESPEGYPLSQDISSRFE